MRILLLILIVVALSCKDNQAKSENVETIETQVKTVEGVHIVDYDGLKPYLYRDDDRIHVVNFWATWCAPCVKELPYFEALHEDYTDQNIDVLLVSLDFPNKYETKLIPFIEKYELKSEVIALDDTNQNRWIPAIDQNWSGAIPATIIYKGDQRKFYEQSFTQEELITEIEKFLN